MQIRGVAGECTEREQQAGADMERGQTVAEMGGQTVAEMGRSRLVWTQGLAYRNRGEAAAWCRQEEHQAGGYRRRVSLMKTEGVAGCCRHGGAADCADRERQAGADSGTQGCS